MPQDSVGPRLRRVMAPLKSLLRRVLRPLCACKPHKLRPEGRDRKLGGEQVREFRRIPIRKTCMHMRITPVLLVSLADLLRKPVHRGEKRAAFAPDTLGIILA